MQIKPTTTTGVFRALQICSKDRIKYIKGTKAMKDKDRITSMVCTSVKGMKCPIAYVGRAKRPRCFSGANDKNFSLV